MSQNDICRLLPVKAAAAANRVNLDNPSSVDNVGIIPEVVSEVRGKAEDFGHNSGIISIIQQFNKYIKSLHRPLFHHVCK